jgi:FHA domain
VTDDVEPVVRGIQKRFRDLSVDVREERVIRYIVKQLRLGRHLDAILEDSYLSAHTSAEDRAEMLQNPAVIHALEDEIRRQFASYRPATRSGGEKVGKQASAELVPCGACNAQNPPEANFCSRCGSRLTPIDLEETTLSFAVAEREEAGSEAMRRAVLAGPVLLIRAGGGREGEVVGIESDVLTVGRSPHSDLFLDDVTVSRHHARILRDETGFLVEDLNSLNGTYVNRKRIERHQLFDGDEVQIGKFKVAFLEQANDL